MDFLRREKELQLKLYHYTNLSTVHAILNGSKLRATDFAYLNDSKELLDGVEFISKYLNEENKRQQRPVASTPFFINSSTWKNERLQTMPRFVASFSATKDKLSQWRAYGMYCIEFDLERTNCTYNEFYRCLYSDEDKIKACEEIVRDLEYHLEPNEPLCIEHADGDFLKKALCFKNDSFEEEDEYRVIVEPTRYTTAYEEFKTNIEFRERNNVTIPFISLNIGIEDISEVIVGPIEHKDLAHRSLQECVDYAARKYSDKHDLSNRLRIPVTKSKSTYRGF